MQGHKPQRPAPATLLFLFTWVTGPAGGSWIPAPLMARSLFSQKTHDWLLPQGLQQTSDLPQRVLTAGAGWPSPSSGTAPCFILFREESPLSFHLSFLFFNSRSHLQHRARPSSCSLHSFHKASVPKTRMSSGVTENSKPLTFFIANSPLRSFSFPSLSCQGSLAFSSPGPILPMFGVLSCPQGIRKTNADRHFPYSPHFPGPFWYQMLSWQRCQSLADLRRQ